MHLLSLVFLILTLVSCSERPSLPSSFPVAVTVFKIEPQDIPATFEIVARTESSHLVEIRARVEGYLNQIAYSEGEFVKEGALLFQLDPKPFEAKLNSAQGELAKQQAIQWDAERSVERYQPLFEQKAASRRDLDNATANLLAAQASVQSATANLNEAELNLGYTTIYSPIAGLAGPAKYREGTLITPSINGLLTTISVIDPIWVNFSISESDLLTIQRQSANKELLFPKDNAFQVRLTLSDETEYPELGIVNFLNPYYDQKTGTLNIRTTFKNPKGTLLPGQFVRAEVLGAIWPQAIIVPQKAILQGSKGISVYIVDAEGKAALKNIETGAWYENYWIVKSGLQPGEQVIVEGVNKVQIGMPVKVTKQLTYSRPPESS